MAGNFITVERRNGATILVNTAHITHVTSDSRHTATIWLSDGNHYEIKDDISKFTLKLIAQEPSAEQ
jgi:uncharacterized protein YlzI (FlbEa/FlbD family)